MSEGKRISRLLGRCFIARGYQQLPAIHFQVEAAGQCYLVQRVKQALYAVAEKCFFFLCWKRSESGGQWRESGPSVGLTGDISHGGSLEQICSDNRNEELMEMPI